MKKQWVGSGYITCIGCGPYNFELEGLEYLICWPQIRSMKKGKSIIEKSSFQKKTLKTVHIF